MGQDSLQPHAVAVVLVIYRSSIYTSLALSESSSVHAPLVAADTARSTVRVANWGICKFRAGQWSAPFAAQEPVLRCM